MTNCDGFTIVDNAFPLGPSFSFFIGSPQHFNIDFYNLGIQYFAIDSIINEEECSYWFEPPLYNNEYLSINTNLYFTESLCTINYKLEGIFGGLPLELINFNLQSNEKQNTLLWQTASATNEDYFVLQHSFDGLNFRDLAQIKTINHNSGIESYQYKHSSTKCDNYYRIQTVNFNGVKRTISNILNADNCNSIVNIYPTLTTGLVHFTNTQPNNINIFNALGQQLEVPITNDIINLSNQPNGQYFIKTDNGLAKIVKY